jgi:pyruvate dehydrogenase E2 component (dihydrolipoamide acetyltransferase)
MTIDFVLPSLGADMDEAMLVAWLVGPGDPVEYGQVIAEVETDKGVIEIECWHDGQIEELLRQPGPEKLAVGTPLARIAAGAEAVAETVPEAPPVAPSPRRPPGAPRQAPPPIRHLAHKLGVDIEMLEGTGADGSVTREDIEKAAARLETPPPKIQPRPAGAERVKASPRARAQAREMGLDLSDLAPTGPDGLIVARDLEGARAETGAEDKMAAMRRAITRSMSRSKREIPHYYLATRIDMERALGWLEELNSDRPITKRILPAVLLLKAAAKAIRAVPDLNGHWVDDRFTSSEQVHLGVAISLREGGLVAPAIHDADTLGLDEMMQHLRDLVARARSWRLRGSEMSDPTITVTNLGDRGVDTAFPVIIPPQVAMVGFGKVVEEVVAVDGEAAVHPVVHATLSADHRVTDGHTGGLYLTELDRLLQKPEEL